MANFRTHIQVASAASGLLAAGLVWAGQVSLSEGCLLWLAGSLGGILPDMDSDSSRALDIVFRLFGLLGAILALLFGRQHLSLVDTLVVGALAYGLVRYPLCWAFARFTVHRASLHSLLANAVFGLVTVVLADRLFGLEPEPAWLAGLFVFSGAGIHLLLDELYSIDLEGRRIKKSFGTALKLVEWPAPLPNLLLLALLAGSWWLTPARPELLARLLPVFHIW
ncbi:metal-dependent hydrolase [Oceanimonas pelagia]|uniref:Metal-dependent hydrolase n=1 Tax=Oceanimonas pelagia TaxID=3028314 RepID=A0AA50Q9C6_9GAMM|nr:metal-dependent hydrolase [Oceanimonas pelagia]WMC09953.1 metal-dependent hydrolase [Oceanimonas pelagia]